MKPLAAKILCCALMTSTVALAGESAYINLDKVTSEYYRALEKTESIKEKQTKAIAEINRRSKELQALMTEFAAKQRMATETTDPAKRAAIVNEMRELQLKTLRSEAEWKAFQASEEASLKKEFAKVNAEILEDIDAKLEEFAKGKNLEAIFDVSGRKVLYYDKSKEITDQLLVRLNVGHEDYVRTILDKRPPEERFKNHVVNGLLPREAEHGVMPPFQAPQKRKPAIPIVAPPQEE
jgi:Skp family chaperone for outer membrane proteins